MPLSDNPGLHHHFNFLKKRDNSVRGQSWASLAIPPDPEGSRLFLFLQTVFASARRHLLFPPPQPLIFLGHFLIIFFRSVLSTSAQKLKDSLSPLQTNRG